MIATLVIVFREVLEAGLVIGIVLAATRGLPGRFMLVGGGALVGAIGACVVAGFADAISSAFDGSGQELFNAAILTIAVAMLAWHIVWMARHGREMARDMRAVGAAVVAGERPMIMLAVVVGAAVLREGAEVVLFLYSLMISGERSVVSLAVGGLAGVGLGAVAATLLYAGLVRLPVKSLFRVTGWMLGLLAAGLAAQAVRFLAQAGYVAWGGATLWDTSEVLSEKSVLGRILHVLVGYTDQPSAAQAVAYLGVLATLMILGKVAGGAKPTPPRIPTAIPAE